MSRSLTASRSKRFKEPITGLIVELEALQAKHQLVKFHRGQIDLIPTTSAVWDTSLYLSEPSGMRLAEEIYRRARVTIERYDEAVEYIAIALPGTLSGTSVIMRSTRLGIFTPINITEHFERLNGPPCYVFHDAECLAIGEARWGCLRNDQSVIEHRDNFAYVLVDEGVGSSLFSEGKVLRGAGSAGHLGRLIVEPRGSYNRTFASRGALEVFASRPWISRNLVGEYLSEQGKGGSLGPSSPFRAAVQTAAQTEEWDTLSIAQIAEGYAERDPIAVSVIDDAARYLGLSLNSIIAVANPPSIVIGGSLVEGVPGIFDQIVHYARRYSWGLAWNRTRVHQAELGRKAEIFGAAELLKKEVITGLSAN